MICLPKHKRKAETVDGLPGLVQFGAALQHFTLEERRSVFNASGNHAAIGSKRASAAADAYPSHWFTESSFMQ